MRRTFQAQWKFYSFSRLYLTNSIKDLPQKYPVSVFAHQDVPNFFVIWKSKFFQCNFIPCSQGGPCICHSAQCKIQPYWLNLLLRHPCGIQLIVIQRSMVLQETIFRFLKPADICSGLFLARPCYFCHFPFLLSRRAKLSMVLSCI